MYLDHAGSLKAFLMNFFEVWGRLGDTKIYSDTYVYRYIHVWKFKTSIVSFFFFNEINRHAMRKCFG